MSITEHIEAFIGMPLWAVALIGLFIWHGLVGLYLSTHSDMRHVRSFEQKEKANELVALFTGGRALRHLDEITNTLKLILYVLVVWFLVDVGVLDRP